MTAFLRSMFRLGDSGCSVPGASSRAWRAIGFSPSHQFSAGIMKAASLRKARKSSTYDSNRVTSRRSFGNQANSRSIFQRRLQRPNARPSCLFGFLRGALCGAISLTPHSRRLLSSESLS